MLWDSGPRGPRLNLPHRWDHHQATRRLPREQHSAHTSSPLTLFSDKRNPGGLSQSLAQGRTDK